MSRRPFGNETNAWTGKPVTLYRSETDFAGKTVPCIRVKEAPAQMPDPELKETGALFDRQPGIGE